MARKEKFDTTYFTLVSDSDTRGRVEDLYLRETEAVRAWERMRRQSATYSSTLWRHTDDGCCKIRDFDREPVNQ